MLLSLIKEYSVLRDFTAGYKIWAREAVFSTESFTNRLKRAMYTVYAFHCLSRTPGIVALRFWGVFKLSAGTGFFASATGSVVVKRILLDDKSLSCPLRNVFVLMHK